MPITLKNPASDLAAALTGNTVGGVALVSGTNLFFRQIHPVPMGLQVVLLNTGSFAPEPYLSPTASAYFRDSVQVLVYGMPGEDGFGDGETLARGLAGELQQRAVSGYVSVTLVSGPFNYVGQDPDTQRHIWSLNVNMTYTA